MLNEEQLTANANRYAELCSFAEIDLNALMPLFKDIAFFDKPLMPNYNFAYRGGLCEYAIKVAHEMYVLANHYFPGRYSQRDILVVALLKDIYRAVMYEECQKNVKNDATGQWETVTAYRTKEERPLYGDLGFSSYMTVKGLVELTEEQIEAIVHAQSSSAYSIDLRDIMKKYPLVAITKMADMAVLNFSL